MPDPHQPKGATSEDDHLDDVLHEAYLPFTARELGTQFLHAATAGSTTSRYVAYYKKSLRRLAEHNADIQRKTTPRHDVRHARQVEKDERFWTVASFMSLYYRPVGGGPAEVFSALLDRAGLKPPVEFADWPAALSGPLDLFFEVSLPSPPSYSAWLRRHLAERAPIPYVQESASPTRSLEGATHADAVLLAPHTGVAVIFEAKVLSDVSTHVTFDVARNQLARNIDVLTESRTTGKLSARKAEYTYLVLVTPELFRSDPALRRSRLYGWLMPEYHDPSSELLSQHLPHREPEQLAGVHERLGWATWEDIRAIDPAGPLRAYLPTQG